MAKYFSFDEDNERIYVNLDLVTRIGVQAGKHVTLDFAAPEGALRTISFGGQRNVEALLAALRDSGCHDAH